MSWYLDGSEMSVSIGKDGVPMFHGYAESHSCRPISENWELKDLVKNSSASWGVIHENSRRHRDLMLNAGHQDVAKLENISTIITYIDEKNDLVNFIFVLKNYAFDWFFQTTTVYLLAPKPKSYHFSVEFLGLARDTRIDTSNLSDFRDRLRPYISNEPPEIDFTFKQLEANLTYPKLVS